ncbi:MAG: aspartate kinase [Xanthomonadales bacterium]|nr:aspartate kinase [Xanthomonadales bacterium]
MSEKWVVLKFGGSSVRGIQQWRAIAACVQARRAEGFRVLVVCSAIEGITNLLEAITRAPVNQALFDQFVERHAAFADELGIDGRAWIDKAAGRLKTLCDELDGNAPPPRAAEILALGEWLSTRLGWVRLNREFATEWVDVRGLLEVRPEPEHAERRRWLSAECTPGADTSMLAGLNGCAPVVITQGFIAAMPGGGTALLGRGGSDTSAVLLGGRISAERVEIWTDVPGLFSADPRLVPNARLLCRLDYAETLEMAASGAGVIHARCLRAAAETGTPIWIRDTARPNIGGTLIDGKAAALSGPKAVLRQGGMAVLLLQNIDPRQQVGFLAWVFDTVAKRGISIDLVATSETTTTIALNCRANHLEQADLASLGDALRSRCKVAVFEDCVTVNVVGRGVHSALPRLAPAFDRLGEGSLLMLSQSANDLCLSMLVRAGDELDLLRAVHTAVVPADSESALFGPSWEALEIEASPPVAAGSEA